MHDCVNQKAEYAVFGVDPDWWTPSNCAKEVFGWEKVMGHTRRSTGARWWS